MSKRLERFGHGYSRYLASIQMRVVRGFIERSPLVSCAIAHTRIQTPAYVGVPPCPEQELQEQVRQLPVSDCKRGRRRRSRQLVLATRRHWCDSASAAAKQIASFPTAICTCQAKTTVRCANAHTRIQTSAFVPKISGTKHNVFGIQKGVAVMFLVKVKKEME